MRNRNPMFLAGVTLVAAALVGCGGKVEGEGATSDLAENPGAVGTFGGTTMRAYFGTTNTFDTQGKPALMSFDLLAGARVELEVVTRDGSPLELELQRVRRDGTTEMVEHVHVASGFHLETFEADSPNTYQIYFPSKAHAFQTIIVHLGCKEGAYYGHCTPAGQPGESCSAIYPCDTGLVCSVMPATAYTRGACILAPEVEAEPR